MIRFVKGNRRGFREVEFSTGANLVLADRSKSAGDKDTTNALGKSTLIDIIDFCLGSNPKKNKGLRAASLAGWEFTLGIALQGEDISVTRSVDTHGFVAIEGNTNTWPLRPEANKAGISGFDVRLWRVVLGWALFGLETAKSERGYRPSPRSLL